MEELENGDSSLYAKECENTTSTIKDYKNVCIIIVQRPLVKRFIALCKD